jgi:8-oxo-dGTP pyrophosphatase MutT (NUDIX family)
MAIDADGIAQVPGTLVVLSPHQNNFEMPLRVEVWDGPPPDDTAEWPEAFEAHLEIDPHGLSYNSPTMTTVSLGVPPGRYHTLITGRGFVAHGWPGSTTPGDSWRLRLWPSASPQPPRRLSAWHAPGTEPTRPARAGQAPGSQLPDHRPGSQQSELRGSSGHEVERDFAERPGVVMVVALDAAGRILLVPARGAFTALPARQVDQSDDNPLAAAQELLAEAGLRAGTWNTLLDLPALPDETNTPSRIYLAPDLRPVRVEENASGVAETARTTRLDPASPGSRSTRRSATCSPTSSATALPLRPSFQALVPRGRRLFAPINDSNSEVHPAQIGRFMLCPSREFMHMLSACDRAGADG